MSLHEGEVAGTSGTLGINTSTQLAIEVPTAYPGVVHQGQSPVTGSYAGRLVVAGCKYDIIGPHRPPSALPTRVHPEFSPRQKSLHSC